MHWHLRIQLLFLVQTEFSLNLEIPKVLIYLINLYLVLVYRQYHGFCRCYLISLNYVTLICILGQLLAARPFEKNTTPYPPAIEY